jgi:DNA-binding protein HU-beta
MPTSAPKQASPPSRVPSSRQILSGVIQKSTGVSKSLANETVTDLIDAIVKSLKRTGSFSLVGFGTIKVQRRAARKGRNPKTGEAIKIRAGKTVRFKPSVSLRRSV